MDEKEVQIAFGNNDGAMFEIIFNGIKDDELPIRKSAMQMVLQILTKTINDKQSHELTE